jgi:hypothetical protein
MVCGHGFIRVCQKSFWDDASATLQVDQAAGGDLFGS